MKTAEYVLLYLLGLILFTPNLWLLSKMLELGDMGTRILSFIFGFVWLSYCIIKYNNTYEN